MTKQLESLDPELFDNLPLRQDDILPADNELTDDQMVQFLEQWEEEMKVAFDFYDHLLENEVRAFQNATALFSCKYDC